MFCPTSAVAAARPPCVGMDGEAIGSPSKANFSRPRNILRSFGDVTDTTKGLSKKVHCMSASSIHILYNHAPSGGVGPPPGRCTPLLIFSEPEVVPFPRMRDGRPICVTRVRGTFSSDGRPNCVTQVRGTFFSDARPSCVTYVLTY